MKKYVTISEDQQCEIHVYYYLGGMNYFTYKQEPRGIYVSIQPCKVTDRGGYNIIEYCPMNGAKFLLEELKRANAKKLAQWEECVAMYAEQLAKAYMENDRAEVRQLLCAM